MSIVVTYALSYAFLRTTHIVIHAGAYYENGVKKFYGHRMEIEPTISFLFPIVSETAKIIFTPLMHIETLFWRWIFPAAM